VVECAVIGASDAIRGEVLEAYVVTTPDRPEDDVLAKSLQRLVKERYAAHAYPRRVHFVPQLPKTPSGKIRHQALREERENETAGMDAG
jgi:acetyl-CoA synthetase